jgi:hypothetical protein
MTKRTLVRVLGAMLLCAPPGRAVAQNLFEVQVFPDETLSKGETSLEFHHVVMPSGIRLPDRTVDPSRHLHVSFEISHGWTDTFETGFHWVRSRDQTSPSQRQAGQQLEPRFDSRLQSFDLIMP